MSRYDEHYTFRDQMRDGLRRDLFGPVDKEDDEEIVNDPPATTYVTGILFPVREQRQHTAETDVDLSSVAVLPGDVDEVVDTGVAMANVQAPSSMGLTFAVDCEVSSALTIEVTVASYDPIGPDGNRVEAKRSTRGATGEDDIRWRRVPVPAFSTTLDLADAPDRVSVVDKRLECRLRVRKPKDGTVSITVTLINITKIPENGLHDEHCFCQAGITVRGAIVQRPGPGGGDEDEVIGSRLLHRYAPTFAVGHGCSVEWDWTPPAPAELVGVDERDITVPEVRTTFVPSHDVLLTDSNTEIDSRSLMMRELARADRQDLVETLNRLAAAYGDWIEERRTDATRLSTESFRVRAGEHLDRCVEAKRRIESGIRLLRSNAEAYKAFQLANEAMALQRGRTVWIKGGRNGEPVYNGRWRPFQIAFMLQCLDGIVDPEHDDRKLVDLLWFPTGGGKTEAYLGLIAFTVFLRRLRRGAAGEGVTAIMRYTLRLLTLQQFERAAALICAMEQIRRRNERRLGTTPISLGMWVGQSATPNSLKDAKAALKKLETNPDLNEKNPVQLHACPWCGTKMDHRNYVVDVEHDNMRIFCGRPDCPYRDALPVHVVDEMVYREHPTLIIATSDKFARLPWREDVASLFNCDIEDGLPPELIVQDELHLISGPLGSLAGLYETAIDEIAKRPKVIASTATIRRAREQALHLFDREVAQFPPPGLDARDSWFAVETPSADKANRRYVGLLAPNTSQATLLVRVYAALLDRAARNEGKDSVRDAYWTLVGYFNSLRLLAAAELQVHADVRERLGQLVNESEQDARPVDAVIELTSRIKSTQVPKHLKQLEQELPDDDVLDVVLATNMISVGVDVDRLGLMAIMGQPQTTAEYIQASSRVGRSHPGMVVTLLNAARSRDRSHYENFASYHSALYRTVESTSVTPFSARARDRGLHAVVVGMARLLHKELRPNDAAADIDRYPSKLEEVKDLILNRVQRVAKDEYESTEAQIDDIIDWWRGLAICNSDLKYEAPPRQDTARGPYDALLRNYTDEDLTEAFPTLWSLRDVDAETRLFLER
ncbi:helicase-related protein [Crossiella cryophila]|uniref:Helicase C-terminal domain-containing protein n=1 Tax=Crossiella cryophila TaxID=43355 RepID=A0A7W7FSR3_9PSEU|nr:helicase-related protein [Crossiella cryophila]MBB4676462.1 hypothetical protein [Crossiella cryophila]